MMDVINVTSQACSSGLAIFFKAQKMHSSRRLTDYKRYPIRRNGTGQQCTISDETGNNLPTFQIPNFECLIPGT
jgi:hypothetical protein